MRADAVIFDKDGTLLDFDAFWVSVSVKVMEDVLAQLEMQKISVDEILAALGVHDGVTDIDGALCKGTYEQIGQIVYGIVNSYGCDRTCDEVVQLVLGAYNAHADAGEIKPTVASLVQVLTALKEQDKKLAVVTTDNAPITEKCLNALGIKALFDRIYTDDGNTPVKPDPYCALDFCRYADVDKERVVMVGDTMTDVNFAKNAGIAVIGVARTEKNRQMLEPYADAVVTDLSKLLEILQ